MLIFLINYFQNMKKKQNYKKEKVNKAKKHH